MNNVIILLHAKAYSFFNEKDNKQLEGIKINYLLTDNLNPIQSSSDEKGYLIANNSIMLDKVSHIKEVPGLYKPIFHQTISKGQVIQKLIDVDFISAINPIKENNK